MNTPAAQVDFKLEPLWLSRRDALRYLGWAPKLFDTYVRSGAITPRKWGPNGAIVYSREQLLDLSRRAVGEGGAANDIDDEFGLNG